MLFLKKIEETHRKGRGGEVWYDGRMKYWLMKSEASCYSIDDLEKEGRTIWDGVRNYQARNFMRDDMQVGDQVLFYHSNTAPVGIVGLAEVASAPYADPTQFDPKNDHYDPTSKKEDPRWVLVDVRFIEKWHEPVTLSSLKNDPFFVDMPLTQKGMRLSVQPVAKKHFDRIVKRSSK